MNFHQFPFIEIFAQYDINIRKTHDANHIKEDFVHVCDQIQIFYNMAGEHLITLDDLQFRTKHGDMIVIHPWHSHRIQCLSDNCVYGYIQFSPKIFDSMQQIPHLKTDIPYWINNAGKSHENHFVLTEHQQKKLESIIYKYDEHSGFAVDYFRFSTFLEALAYVVMCIKRFSEFKDGKSANTSISKRAMEYIDLHFRENIPLSDIASHLYVTEKYLCNIFKKQTGFTVKQYVSHCRIQTAKNILNDATKTPKDAFASSGYNDYPTFLRMFKKLTGSTPTDYYRTRCELVKQRPVELLEKLSDKLPEE